MKQALKQYYLRLWSLQGGDLHDPAEVEALEAAIRWRFALFDRLAGQVKRGALSRHEFEKHIRGVVVKRQLETELLDYQDELDGLVELAVEGEIDEEEFSKRLMQLTLAILILALLIGSVSSREELSDNALYGAAILVVQQIGMSTAEMTPEQYAQLAAATEILDRYEEYIPAAALLALQEKIVYSEESTLGEDIYEGVYEDNQEALDARIGMWVVSALAMYTIGQLVRKDDPFYMWVRDPMKESCEDCLRLDGQIHTKVEWDASGWFPQSAELECYGIYCGCQWVETNGPSSGSF